MRETAAESPNRALRVKERGCYCAPSGIANLCPGRILVEVPSPFAACKAATLTPLGYLEWVPLPGWDSVTAQTAKGFHRVNIVWLREVPEVPAPVTP